jgi:hypothetical protein
MLFQNFVKWNEIQFHFVFASVIIVVFMMDQ